MLDRRSAPLARVPGFGWAWHGLMVQPQGSGVVTITLPNGQTYTGSSGGNNRVLRPWPWTYLWNVGRPGLEQTEAEAARGARFDGAAILRGFGGPMYAYGNAYFGTYDPLEIAGWPVRFANATGRALLRIRRDSSGVPDPDHLELLVYPSLVLGGAPVDPVVFAIDARHAAIGQSAPDLYEGPEPLAAMVTSVRFNTLDMTPDGRSLLLGLSPVNSGNLIRARNVAQWCGLLRLSITGDPDDQNIGYQLVIEQTRNQALGELVDELTGAAADVQRYTLPPETVSTVQPWPACGVTEVLWRGGFTEEPNTAPPVISIEGTQTYRRGQTGVMAGAWFDAAGAVQIARFDSLEVQTVETVVTDSSAGERRERTEYTVGPSECVANPTTITDDMAYRLNGQINATSTYSLRLYGTDGGLFDEQVLKIERTNTEWYDSTQDPDNQSTVRTVLTVDGTVVSDVTSSPEGGSLTPGSGTPFGFRLTELVARYHAERGALAVDTHQVRVLNGSNKVTLLGRSSITEAGPDTLLFRQAMTPGGTVAGVLTRYAGHEGGLQPRRGFDSSQSIALTRASYNPVTHQVERHRADLADFGWV
ncbi:hypothetical protein NK553_18455 [Pseudomonas sp. ZM23]|uniref:Tip attachment protein J domain-containing protein n=1 Tax=Pseudomonas triclosanedens TaxID=2961893 RepID=A0ABY6ZSW1_9PSED|nr:hypothetical protein [Pseudomonas triclosanedens]MCP8465937.1 hypothetical protein [Pseudomonas triclosanedens]MCP8472258.1 hypothetical protein [Pseudomonas triclosanedens]MCP8477236.1 hypothetical protein [Pseudomonas triclosanedens]WAI47426.1 hypothetical protein OU419_16760 [Pseudomonas triclosanedens]